METEKIVRHPCSGGMTNKWKAGMKRKRIRVWKKAKSFEISRLFIWPMVVADWGLALFAMFLSVTHVAGQ
jgi:hypothetical protein